MRNYPQSAGVMTRVTYGVDLSTALELNEETRGEGQAIGEMSDAMFEKHQELLRQQRATAKIRGEVRVHERRVERAVRQCSLAARSADGGQPGAVSRELFPDGLKPEVAPLGLSQQAQTEALLARFGRATLPKARELAAAWNDPITAVLDPLRDALTRRTASEGAEARLNAELAAAGAAHRREVDRLMGVARARFPQDKAAQDALFPPVAARKKRPQPVEG